LGEGRVVLLLGLIKGCMRIFVVVRFARLGRLGRKIKEDWEI
jgi:hypothetical protein